MSDAVDKAVKDDLKLTRASMLKNGVTLDKNHDAPSYERSRSDRSDQTKPRDPERRSA